MEKIHMKRLILAGLIAAFAGAAYGGSMFTLIPVNATTTVPGGITGWGYDIANADPSNFMLLNDSFAGGSLSTGTYGNYVDYIVTNPSFIVIGPGGDSGPVPFIPGTSGIGEFDFKQFVPVPTYIPGTINVDYSLFSQDPNSPTFDPGSFVTSGTLTANAQASMVPEPAPGLLIGLALLPFAFVTRRHCR
jgi:hypothetical protein